MSDYCDIIDGEKQVDENFQTKSEIFNGVEKQSNELDLFDDKPKEQSTTEKELDSKEPFDNELLYDNKMFGDILRKMKAFIETFKQDKVIKRVFINKWEILNEVFHIIKTNENTFTDEDLLAITKGLDVLACETQKFVRNEDFSSDPYGARTIFYKYFQLIDISVIKQFLKNPQSSDSLKRLYCIGIQTITRDMTQTLQPRVFSLNDIERPTNCIELFALLMNFVKTNLETLNTVAEYISNSESETRRAVLNLLSAYSDKTIFIPDLIEAGCVEIIIDGLAIVCKKPNIDNELESQLIAIINNISRHDDGITKLNSLNIIQLIQKFHGQHNTTEFNVQCCMIMALLSSSEEIKKNKKHMDDVLDTLLEMVYKTLISPNNSAEGFHLSEPLIVLVKLFSDDRTLDYVMEHSKVDLHTTSTLDFFINLFVDYYSKVSEDDLLREVTCTTLVNILWSVSFQRKYKQQLKNTNSKLIELLNDLSEENDENILSNQYVPKYLENIHKAAKGFLFNIDELTDSPSTNISDTPAPLSNNQKPIIMISYSHQNTDFCKQLLNEIEKRGYDIWIDFKFLKTGDLWEQIAAGMKRASAIICLMSEEYCESKSCRWEATFALDKLLTTKPVIPLLLREHELPDWLGIRIAMLKYILFKNVDILDGDKLSELINDLQTSVPTSVKESDVRLPSAVLPTSSSSSRTNEVSSRSDSVSTAIRNESVQPISSGTKSVNQEIVSQNASLLRPTNNPCTYSNKPIQQWNQDDISQWFQYNGIITELKDLCQFQDGYELMTYAKLFLKTEHLQYQMYGDEFQRIDGITCGQKPLLLHEFTKFSNALRKLQTSKQST